MWFIYEYIELKKVIIVTEQIVIHSLMNIFWCLDFCVKIVKSFFGYFWDISVSESYPKSRSYVVTRDFGRWHESFLPLGVEFSGPRRLMRFSRLTWQHCAVGVETTGYDLETRMFLLLLLLINFDNLKNKTWPNSLCYTKKAVFDL